MTEIFFFNITDDLVGQTSIKEAFKKSAEEALALEEKYDRTFTSKINSFSVTGEMIIEFSENFIQDEEKEGNLQDLTDYFSLSCTATKDFTWTYTYRKEFIVFLIKFEDFS